LDKPGKAGNSLKGKKNPKRRVEIPRLEQKALGKFPKPRRAFGEKPGGNFQNFHFFVSKIFIRVMRKKEIGVNQYGANFCAKIRG